MLLYTFFVMSIFYIMSIYKNQKIHLKICYVRCYLKIKYLLITNRTKILKYLLKKNAKQ